jgi:hypothetical protein
MSINLAEETLEDRLVNRITALEKDLRDLKTKQFIGGDNTVVTHSSIASGVTTLLAGEKVYFTLLLTPALPRVTLWDFAFTIYVDGTGFDSDNVYPDGLNLTTAMKQLRLGWWLDWGTSNDITGQRVWRIQVENFDVSSHVIGVQATAYAIKTSSTI